MGPWLFYLSFLTFPAVNQAEDIQTPYDIWLASRAVAGSKELLIPGAQRPLTFRNARLAYMMLQSNTFGLFKRLCGSHPKRTVLMLATHLARSMFPAFRGYSQALIIDEIQLQFTSDTFSWPRLLHLTGTELIRRYIEGLLDSYASHNENIVLDSAKFTVEFQQLQQRVRLDCPTFTDPLTRDLLHESDLFARSFNGSSFGSISPLDFLQMLSLVAEIVSHLFLILSVTRSYTHIWVLVLSLCSTCLPLVIPQAVWSHNDYDSQFTPREARAADRREKMRNIAFSDIYRPEVQLFGLQEWILSSWASAWRTVHDSELAHQPKLSFISGFSDSFRIFQNLMFDFQVPFLILLQSSSATLGSLSLYRSSIHSVIFSFRSLVTTTKMAFQSVFLMAAWCASTELKPKLQPEKQNKVNYKSESVAGGISIRARRNVSYTYPGCSEPALKNVNFDLIAGEALAIVGYNGSGKSTLAKILLRIIDFDEGELIVNGHSIRRYDPSEYHQHLSAVMQGFSKFNSTFRENVGVGSIAHITSRESIETAVNLAQADDIVNSLPKGLQTVLESPAFEPISYPGSISTSSTSHGLSGGEWQRIAIARAFMRANDPSIDLLIFDEPTSSLDAKAQKEIFDTIHRLTRHSDGSRRRTVIFITHRLSLARKADRVAMMENGTIAEFGTHEQLLEKNGSYASLYNQSV
ncbi:P-loop containing nucleoside triphosphate hydrolase protein [Rhodocollybia butyracea]|uniref:P-loop containing nucleoside triphosphate hydrolase protein n=1 Tax=Rhodocollybia butyracea TaxID=206335 RepID=A0A9P5Q920_9AGAR|nr:P-loop containing nucleoside triphosphate hydrolase protein [Rhodocollybia butyracea]